MTHERLLWTNGHFLDIFWTFFGHFCEKKSIDVKILFSLVKYNFTDVTLYDPSSNALFWTFWTFFGHFLDIFWTFLDIFVHFFEQFEDLKQKNFV